MDNEAWKFLRVEIMKTTIAVVLGVVFIATVINLIMRFLGLI